ncbi:18939_t:CDS:2 [Dentiscutata erythropus]|uniref:18939_t:CDS:1 n=1 Tax=Dentiscutata erythropus TaxID=1348616 RepID=A0A9N9B7U7_9GLOM|nr:18939_t:CDS:2 [Dentiscutata erythropus]
MFSRADDERLQFIRKQQNRFRRGGQEKDESLSDEAELNTENIYLPASHTLSYRCQRYTQKNNKCQWNYPKSIQEYSTIDNQGPDRAEIRIQTNENNETDKIIVNEIKDYLNAQYLSAMVVIWQIFKYNITSQMSSVTCLLIHLPNEQIILHKNYNIKLSTLQRYFLRPTNTAFNDLTYCRYNELYTFSYIENITDQY